MVENETSWWILQVQFPERYKDQPDLLTEPIPRDDLIRQAFSLIYKNQIYKRRTILGVSGLGNS